MQIDKNIKPPPKKQAKQKSDRRPGADRKYPFPSMAIDNSFLLECDSVDYDRIRQNVATACHLYKKKHPEFNFEVRKVEGGIRVWRVAVKEVKKDNF